MKNRLLAIASLFIVSLYSCKPDACKDVTCLNGGVCVSGECACAVGFEGTNCDTEQRLAFVGTYSIEESCNLGDFTYEITVAADSEVITEITVNNLADLNFDITGVVDGTAVTFSNQTVNGSTISGTGLLENSTLSIDYTLVSNNGQTLTCTLTGLIL